MVESGMRSPYDPTYPCSDGQPIADNTWQYDWIVQLYAEIASLVRHRPDVFVAMDLLWYPVEGEPTVRTAPDTLGAFGRPRGDRWSYNQWAEGGTPPQVVMEVLSPVKTSEEIAAKYDFYDRYGVEEYYVIDPDQSRVEGYRRGPGTLAPVGPMDGFASPRLGIRFAVSAQEIRVHHPDGRPFQTRAKLLPAIHEAEDSIARSRRSIEESRKRFEAAQQQYEEAHQKVVRSSAMLRALGVDPDAGAAVTESPGRFAPGPGRGTA